MAQECVHTRETSVGILKHEDDTNDVIGKPVAFNAKDSDTEWTYQIK